MKKTRIKQVSAILLAAAVLCFCGGIVSGTCENIYTVNEWNFVDSSMDVSGGIPEDASGVLARIRERGVLRVATEPYYPPQEFIDPGFDGQDKYRGADMELARLIAERMGVELHIEEMEFTEVLPAVANDQCDLAVSALSFTPGRASSHTMSKGYYFSDIPKTVIIIRAEDAAEITSVADLAGKTLAAQQGSLQEAMMAANVYVYKEFRRLSQVQEVYSAVARGTADAGAADAETAIEYLANNPQEGLMILPGVEFYLQREYLGDRIAARNGEYELIAFVNGVIDEVLKNQLYDEWIAEARERVRELGM
ncbi:amino acid ABC transporter substrate-binding protein [Clostridiales bacterium]|nr:amino acid ABC transporter substrate-binding protein [Clostridiales bacterium]